MPSVSLCAISDECTALIIIPATSGMRPHGDEQDSFELGVEEEPVGRPEQGTGAAFKPDPATERGM